jgi:hypothetical protein
MQRRLPIVLVFIFLPSLLLVLSFTLSISSQRVDAQGNLYPCVSGTQFAPSFVPNNSIFPANQPSATYTRTLTTTPCTPTPDIDSNPKAPKIFIQNPEPPCTITSNPIYYPTFSNVNNLCFVSAAIHSPPALRLTSASNNQTGAVWFSTKQKVGLGFQTTFTFRITDSTNGGADGLAFVIQDMGKNVAGDTGGCGIGYEGITNSLAIEIDTFKNAFGTSSCQYSDPDDHHIGILSEGSLGNSANHGFSDLGSPLSIPFDFEDGNTHTVSIQYIASNWQLKVTFDGTYTRYVALTNSLSNMLGLVDDSAYVGFTSATGSANAKHEILSWTLNTSETAVGADTIGVYRSSNSTFYLRNTNTTGTADNELTFGMTGDVGIIGDWNGDGIDTIGIYRPSTSQIFLSDLSTNPVTQSYPTFVFGNTSDIPIVGDWDGDGKDSIGLYRPSTGIIYLRNALTSGNADFTMTFSGVSTDLPLANDWNGDGIDSPALYRPSNGVFYLTNDVCNSCTPTLSSIAVSITPQSGDVPFSGDWNGDVLSGVGLRRTNQMMLKQIASSGAVDMQFTYGATGDKPIGGRWQTLCIVSSAGISQISSICSVQVLACSVTVRSGQQVQFRIQPHRDEQYINPQGSPDPRGANWIMEMPAGTPYSIVTPLPTRPWLWQSYLQPNQPQPNQITIQSIVQVADIGVIPWIHPTMRWIQVKITGLGFTGPLYGYMNKTDANGAPVLDVEASCNTAPNLPTPEIPMPTAPPSSLVMPTMASIFGGTPGPIAPAVMGGCFLHDGSTLPCGPNTSWSTIDLIPRNIELCIDTRDGTRLGQCDPDTTQAPNGIPVFSPVAGCMFYTAGKNFVIEFSPTGQAYLNSCNGSTILAYQGSRYQVSLTHLKPFNPSLLQQWYPVSAGELIGYLCRKTEWSNSNLQCKGPASLDPLAPQHLAVHLFEAKTGYITDVKNELPGDIRRFLAKPYCFFDRWKQSNGSTPQLQTPNAGQDLYACP